MKFCMDHIDKVFWFWAVITFSLCLDMVLKGIGGLIS